METLHSLQIADPAIFYRLPWSVQEAHLAHVRNRLGGRYSGSAESTPDPRSATPSRRKGGGLDMMAIMEDVHRLRHAPPSPRAISAARLLLDAPGVPEALLDSARRTIEQGDCRG